MMPYVEVAGATPLSPVVGVLGKTACATGGEVLLRLVDRLRVGVGATEGQALAEALLKRQLSPVVIRVSSIFAVFNGAQTGIGQNRSVLAADQGIPNGAIGV